MDNVFARQVHAINAIIHANQTKSAWMANVSVQVSAKMVGYRRMDASECVLPLCFLAYCPFPCLHGGRCTGFYQCTCRQGWQGHRCERRVTILEN